MYQVDQDVWFVHIAILTRLVQCIEHHLNIPDVHDLCVPFII